MQGTTRSDVREAAKTDDREAFAATVESFMNDRFRDGDVTFDVGLGGIDVVFPKTLEDEPFARFHFKYHNDDPSDPQEPFLNRSAWAHLRFTLDDGTLVFEEDFCPQASDELYAEVQGRFAPHEGDEKAVTDTLRTAFGLDEE